MIGTGVCRGFDGVKRTLDPKGETLRYFSDGILFV